MDFSLGGGKDVDDEGLKVPEKRLVP
ncbi:hypothetical protein RJ641_008120, partial [Dillenia turbinata]